MMIGTQHEPGCLKAPWVMLDESEETCLVVEASAHRGLVWLVPPVKASS